MVLRAPFGGGIHAPEHHSESTEALFAHIPGLRVVIPSSPRRAYGLLLAAIADPDPVVFLEPKRIYRLGKQDVEDSGEGLPLDSCFVLRDGIDITLVSWGASIKETLEAAQELVQDGFDVMVYTNDDPIVARRLEDMGCVSVMPLAAPIGSGLGIRNPYNILTIVENASVPILVDAGVGTASDAAVAMELGCDGVLMNTAIAGARDPVLMASAMRKAIEAGRESFLAGRIPRKRFASASSPVDGTFF